MQDASHKIVVIARKLLPAGLEPLRSRFEVREGGLDSTREDLLALVPGAAALVADPAVPVDAELLDAAGETLMIVANFAVGYDNVDLDACRERQVIVTNTPDVLTQATAELALALTLAAARRMSDAERDLRAGRWRGWDPGAYLGLELDRATVGVVGMGRIGRRYAGLVKALGAQVVYSGPSVKLDAERHLEARKLELRGMLASCEVVSLHAPATPETRHLIGEDEINLIGAGGVLVNTSRGPLVDAEAVATALHEGRLGAAGLDVYENEPQVPQELLEAPRCVLLPHIGSATAQARNSMALLAADNVAAVLEGRDPRTPVT
jgi:glyoxylate reductase